MFKDLWREERQPSLGNDDESYDPAPCGSPAASPGDAGSTEHHPGGPSDSGSSALDAQMAEMGFGDKEIGNMTPEQKQEIVTLLT